MPDKTNIFYLFGEAPVAAPAPAEPATEPANEEDGFYYEKHHVRFNAAGEGFISKDGQCLGLAAGVVKDADAATRFIDEKLKGE